MMNNDFSDLTNDFMDDLFIELIHTMITFIVIKVAMVVSVGISLLKLFF